MDMIWVYTSQNTVYHFIIYEKLKALKFDTLCKLPKVDLITRLIFVPNSFANLIHNFGVNNTTRK